MEIETPNRYEETKAAAAAAVSVVVNNTAVAVSEGETGSEDSDESGNILVRVNRFHLCILLVNFKATNFNFIIDHLIRISPHL